ncbi:unnamed protein product, partial [Meganyctiphanes norvegica]
SIGKILSITFDQAPPDIHGYSGIVLHRRGSEFTLQLCGKDIRVFVDSGSEVNSITLATFQSSMYDASDFQYIRRVGLVTWAGVQEIDVGSLLHVPLLYSDHLTICTSFVVLPVTDNILGLGFLIDTGCKQEWRRNGDAILWVRDEHIIHCDIGHFKTPGLYMTLDFKGVRVQALIDSGASDSLITHDLVEQLNLYVNPIPRVALDANSHSVRIYGVVPQLIIQTDERATWDFFDVFPHQGNLLVPNLSVIDNNQDKLTLGRSFLKQFNCVIDYETTTLYIQKPNGKYIAVILRQIQIEIV